MAQTEYSFLVKEARIGEPKQNGVGIFGAFLFETSLRRNGLSVHAEQVIEQQEKARADKHE